MFVAARDSNFTQDGQALQYCADTPDGLECFDENVRVHPKYGIALEPLTSEQVINRRRRELGLEPDEIDIFATDDIEFFDRIDGRPRIWYHEGSDGRFQLYTGPGRHPLYGVAVSPVDSEQQARQILAWIASEKNARREASEKAQMAAAAEDLRQAKEAEDLRQVKEAEDLRQAEVAEAAAARLLAEEAALALEARRERYVTLGRRESLGWAVVVVDPEDHLDAPWTSELARSIGASDQAFRPAFVQDRLFHRALSGDMSELRDLGIADQIENLILAQRSVRSTESSVDGKPVVSG